MSDFAPYRDFNSKLERLAAGAAHATWDAWKADCDPALDGAAGAELARLVSVEARRKAGTFFTGSRLAALLAHRLPDLTRNAKVLDPTLGAGDLLLAVARRSKLGSNPLDTVRKWEKALVGLDREQEFVEAAKIRLWLLAHLLHGVRSKMCPPPEHFQGFECADVFTRSDIVESATDVVVNPPFNRMAAPSSYPHGGGQVNAAAVILSFLVQHAKAGLRLHAILPEVLRTGTLYEKWRIHLGRECEIRNVQSEGLFDTADVDVFMITLEKRAKATVRVEGGWKLVQPDKPTIQSQFKVCVGSVVDFRDVHEGPSRSFAHPKNIPVWTEVKNISGRRRYKGPVFVPPFVVVRRTSRPGDQWRAVGTLILGKRPVAVENHFVVCVPVDGKIDTCRSLIERLKTQGVNQFLNCQMRCRHLTVDVVKRVPLSD